MTSYVTFPGTAGNYVSTPSVNLLDADSAHLEQSIGEWSAVVATVSLSTDFAYFGTNSAKLVATSVNTSWFTTGDSIPLAPSTQYSYSVMIYTEETGTSIRLSTEEYDSGSGVVGSTVGSIIALASGVWTEFSLTFTSAATAASMAFGVADWSGSVGRIVYVDAACFREGTDPTFVPSLNIVGDLDIRAKVAADDWTTATDRIILDNYDGASGYRLSLDTSDNVALAAFGTTGAIAETTAAFTFVDGDATIIRVVLDVSAGTMDWLQDGTSVDATDTFTAQPLIGSDIGLYVGSLDSDADHFDGDIYYVEIRDGEDGPVVARMDAADAAGAT